jgi:phytoene dehydrogenase-like protein
VGVTETATHDVIIVGAGLAGLQCARHLQRAGRNVLVLESSDGVGGRVRTDVVEGFRLDRGFQVLLTAYPELATEVDLVKLDMRYFDPGALVRGTSKDHIVSDPFRDPGHVVPTALAPIGTVFDKARVGLLRWRVQRSNPRTLLQGEDLSTAEALRKLGFSEKMISRFFAPLVGGIQLDPTLGTSRRMFDIIFRSLSNGDVGVPKNGMGELSAQIATHLAPGVVRLHTPVTHVSPTSVTTESGETLSARCVVVATEGPVATRLTGIAPVASRSVSCVYFAAPTPPTEHKLVVLDGTGSGPVLNLAVMSNVSESYAPAGQHLIAAACPAVTQAGRPNLLDDVRAQLRWWWGPQVDTWTHLKTYDIAHGQPAQDPPFPPKKPISLGEGLFVCGDHRDTGSIQGAMYSGRRCAVGVLEYLS